MIINIEWSFNEVSTDFSYFCIFKNTNFTFSSKSMSSNFLICFFSNTTQDRTIYYLKSYTETFRSQLFLHHDSFLVRNSISLWNVEGLGPFDV